MPHVWISHPSRRHGSNMSVVLRTRHCGRSSLRHGKVGSLRTRSQRVPGEGWGGTASLRKLDAAPLANWTAAVALEFDG
eukprot:506281-Alexandrium_andersonii.AAC.1